MTSTSTPATSPPPTATSPKPSLATRCGFRLHEADTHLGYTCLHLAEARPDLAAAVLLLAAARKIVDATGYHRRDDELTRLTAALALA